MAKKYALGEEAANQLNGLLRQSRRSLPQRSFPQRRNHSVSIGPRLARTIEVPNADPTYPVQGTNTATVFPFVFLDGGFLEEATRQSAQYTALNEDEPDGYVFSISLNYIPVDAVFQVWHDPGTHDDYPGNWWTDFRDGVRIGITKSAIANMANGTVDEYEPENYAEETEVLQTWRCRNWCGYDLEANTPVFFSQRKGVAYILNAACEAAGSGFGSGL